MHLLGSICAFYSPVSANILFMLLHPRCCQFLIHHSWHLPWAYMGKKPNQWYLCMKYETFHNLNVRRGSGRVLMTCAHVHANVTCTMLCMNVMWWLKVEAFQSISLLPVTLGPISASDPNKVTLMWNDRGFHRSPPTVSFFVILWFSYTHTHTLHCSYPSLGNQTHSYCCFVSKKCLDSFISAVIKPLSSYNRSLYFLGHAPNPDKSCLSYELRPFKVLWMYSINYIDNIHILWSENWP